MQGSARIDYVFVDPKRFIVDAAGLAPPAHRSISDHLAVFTDVRLRGSDSSREFP